MELVINYFPFPFSPTPTQVYLPSRQVLGLVIMTSEPKEKLETLSKLSSPLCFKERGDVIPLAPCQSSCFLSVFLPTRLMKKNIDLSMSNNTSMCGSKGICTFKMKIPGENSILRLINYQWWNFKHYINPYHVLKCPSCA